MAMAGYSGKSLARKLGVKPGEVVRPIGAPAHHAALLDPLPEGARLDETAENARMFAGLTADGVRRIMLPTGWVDVKVCAVDADWSGLKFLRRRSRTTGRRARLSGGRAGSNLS